MDGRFSSSTIWSRLLRGEENDEQVNQLLAQFQDESGLQLNLDSHRSTEPLNSLLNSDAGGFDSAGLDDELARRYSKLKAPPPAKPQIGKSNKLQIRDKKENNDLENGIDNDRGKKSDLEKDPDLVGGVRENEGIGGKSRVLIDEEEEKILGQELALRLATLRTSPSAKNIVIGESQSLAEPQESQGIDSRETTVGTQKEKIGDSGETGFVKQNELDSEEEQVQKLLASVQDSIKLERSRVSGISSSSGRFNDAGEEHVDDEERISESEVENIVEWAKDAARLGLVDSEEEDDDDDNYEDVNYEDESDHSEKQSAGTRKAKK